RADRHRRDGAAVRLPARRLDPDRDRVLLARHRLPAQLGDLPARPAAPAGHHPGAGAVLRIPQSGGRRDPGGDRPAHQAGVTMSAVADDLVRIATVEKARGYWA